MENFLLAVFFMHLSKTETRHHITHLLFLRYKMHVVRARLPFSSPETEQLPDSVQCPSETENKGIETAHTSEIDKDIKWPYLHTLSMLGVSFHLRVRLPQATPTSQTLSQLR
jgi:hypothetical protein